MATITSLIKTGGEAMGEASKNQPVTAAQRDIPVDYLRAAMILLVVLLHSALAYTSFSRFDRVTWTKSSAPIVDTVRLGILDPVVMYLDTFFMPLLFLVSGFFILPGIQRYGAGKYIIHRMKRLGVPFVFAALVIAPLAFLPSYLASDPLSTTPYLLRFFTTDGWSTGPAWFLWLLLLFSGIVALIYRVKPDIVEKFNRAPGVGIVFLATFAAFFPLRLIASHTCWLSIGPFDFQPVRSVLYFVCFIMGIAIGSAQEPEKAKLLRKWPLWLLTGLAAFVVYFIFVGDPFQKRDIISYLIISISFTAGCSGSSLGFLGLFRKITKRKNWFFDSLSVNSFVIFITHYLFTIWIQYFLLAVRWTPFLKFILTFFGSLLFSWLTGILLRRIPGVRKFV